MYIQQGTTAFRRATLALFLGGFVTFANLYSTQPLLPIFSKAFHVTPATASLSLSVTTATMAIAMLIAAALSDRWGRKSIMSCSVLLSALLGVMIACTSNFHVLLVLRALQGIVLAGLPAIAMTYINEEFDPLTLGAVMGLYISGNSVGGMLGRIVVGTLTDFVSWQAAMGAVAVIGLVCAGLFYWFLPASQHFKRHEHSLHDLGPALGRHLRNPRLLALFAIAFLLMGSFVTLYNYIGFRLTDAPYHLSQTLVGWIFIVYLTGTFSSTWMGRLADRIGRPKVMWTGLAMMLVGVWMTLVGHLAVVILGIAVFTFGFFGSHSVASAWVGQRAKQDKAQASSLYLLFYYGGSSLAGSVGGLFWLNQGWTGVVMMISVLLVVGLLLGVYLYRSEGDPVLAK